MAHNYVESIKTTGMAIMNIFCTKCGKLAQSDLTRRSVVYTEGDGSCDSEEFTEKVMSDILNMYKSKKEDKTEEVLKKLKEKSKQKYECQSCGYQVTETYPNITEGTTHLGCHGFSHGDCRFRAISQGHATG